MTKAPITSARERYNRLYEKYKNDPEFIQLGVALDADEDARLSQETIPSSSLVDRAGENESVWLLTTGDGSDGDEWYVISIYKTKEGAELAKKEYEATEHRRTDGSHHHMHANELEEWPINASPTQEEGKMSRSQDTYTPYGKEWKAEMMKWSKKQLIDALKSALLAPQSSVPGEEWVDKAARELAKESTAPDKGTPDRIVADIKRGMRAVIDYIRSNPTP